MALLCKISWIRETVCALIIENIKRYASKIEAPTLSKRNLAVRAACVSHNNKNRKDMASSVDSGDHKATDHEKALEKLCQNGCCETADFPQNVLHRTDGHAPNDFSKTSSLKSLKKTFSLMDFLSNIAIKSSSSLRKALYIDTGGIGMVKNRDGALAPQKNIFETWMGTYSQLHNNATWRSYVSEPRFDPCFYVFPKSEETRSTIRKVNKIMKHRQLFDSSNVSEREWMLIASDLVVAIETPTEFNVTGLMPAAFTSLNDDNSINLDAVPAYVDYIVCNGLKSVLVGGSSGEHTFLSLNDRKRIIEAWINASKGKDLHIQVQVGGAPFSDVIDLAEYCATAGVHSILTLPDSYAKLKTVKSLVSFMKLVAKAAPNLPVFYYHIPKKTNVVISMPAFVVAATTVIPNFKGIKFTAVNLVEASQVLQSLQDNQRIFLGGEHLLAPAVLLGIDSCTSPAINLFPGLMQNIIHAVGNGCVVHAREWQRSLSTVVNDISKQGGRIPALKIAMELLTGIKMGPPALPLKPVSEKQRRNIKEKLMNFKC